MTAGEGGMLTTNEDGFAERVRSILDQGRQRDGGWFFHYELGTNYRMTAWQAAVLIAQLERLPEQNGTRAAERCADPRRVEGCSLNPLSAGSRAGAGSYELSVTRPDAQP